MAVTVMRRIFSGSGEDVTMSKPIIIGWMWKETGLETA